MNQSLQHRTNQHLTLAGKISLLFVFLVSASYLNVSPHYDKQLVQQKLPSDAEAVLLPMKLPSGYKDILGSSHATGSKNVSTLPTVSTTQPHANDTAEDFFAYSLLVFYTSPNSKEIDSRGSHCQTLNPHFKFQVYDNAACQEFVQTEYPEFADLYNHLLPLNIMRADMWRYLILHKYGGIYFDRDVECKVPFEEWLPRAKLLTKGVQVIVGLEFRDRFPPLVQFTQWAMASRRPGHPLFYRTVEIINETVWKSMQQGTQLTVKDTTQVTGPKVFTRAVVEYLIQQGRFQPHQVKTFPNNSIHLDDTTLTTDTDEVVGDLAIFHKNAFGYHQLHKGVKGEIFVKHWFAGSWRPK